MKKAISKIQLVLSFVFAFGISGHSQDGALDLTFFNIKREAGTGFNGTVWEIELQSDEKAVVAGRFTSYNGEPASHLIRLNKDGTKDNTFNVGTGFSNLTATPQIHSLLVLPHDKILVGGEFTNYNSSSAPNIIRLNTDGTADPSFDVGPGFNGVVQSLILQPDGKILVGGAFTSYRLEPAPFLIRLNPDGSKDPSFTVDSMVDSRVVELDLQPDGRVLVHFGNDVVRLHPDGLYDPSFTLPSPFGEAYIHEVHGPQVNSVDVNSIKILENGKILLAGYLQTSLKSLIPLVRLNPDGSRDPDFSVYEEEIFGGGYNEITLSSEGKIYSTGMIGPDQQGVQRFNVDGTKDRSFDTGYGSLGRAIALQPDGKLIASMDLEGGESIVRYNQDGSHDFTYNSRPEFDDKVTAVVVQNDGKILLGGEFSVYNGQLANGIVRINTDGSADHTFDSGTGLDGYGFGDRVSEIILQDDEKILVIGSITSYNDAIVGSILRLNQDGTLDSSFSSGAGFNSFLDKDIALQDDGKILVAGSFSSYDGEPVNGIIRINTDGKRDTSFNLGSDIDTRISQILPLPDGKVLIGGGTSGDPTDRLVKLNTDGSRDTSFNVGSSLNIHVQSLVVQPDGKIVVGGSAGTLVQDPRMVCFNPDGTVDPSFTPEIEVQSVKSIILQPDGKFLLSTDSDDLEKVIIRLNSNGTIDPTFHIGDRGFEGRAAHALAIQPDGNIIAGGDFTFFNRTIANRVVRLLNSTEGPSSLTGVIRINAGGGDILLSGEQWEADQYFNGGRIYTQNNSIENTENDPLYQSERYGNVTYDIPVPEEGLYTVELHFAEIHWHKAGARLFRVAVEGGQPGPVIDLYADHGGANAAYVLKIDDISVADGKLTIELITGKDNAKISGIAVFKQNSSTEPVKLRINSGGGALDYGEEQWLEDRYFTGGRTYSINSGEINNTHRDELYRSERYGNFTYSLPAPQEGLYTLELHLAEIYWDVPDSRIFNLAAENGQLELSAVDLYREYGGSKNATVIVADNIKVTDGFLDITVSKTKDNGKISGLVMYKQPEEVDPNNGFIKRINSGGEAMQFAGEEWEPDQYYSGGRTYTNASEKIGNTDKDALYFTERYGEFVYGIPVPTTGLYTVELHFAEIHWKREGARIFNVDVENEQYALKDLDLYREFGGSHLSGIYVANNINVADGILNIDFSKIKENPKISGIVIYKQSTAGARLQTMNTLSKETEREEAGRLGQSLGSKIRLYPNPAKDMVRLEFYADGMDEWDFVLVNSLGTGIHLANFNLELGKYLLEFDLSQHNLSAGTYYLQITNKRGILATKRVIVF